MFSVKGLVAVVITAVVLGVPLYFYWDFLTQGMRPPRSTRILNELERNGVPDFSLPDLSGVSHSLRQYKGKVVLLNIWATWCKPCVKEFPSLQRLVKEFKGQVVVLAVSYDKSREDIESFIAAFGGLPEGFVILLDPQRTTTETFGTEVLPETYILSPEQKLLRKIAGEALWDEPMALEFFRDVLNPSRAAPAEEQEGG